MVNITCVATLLFLGGWHPLFPAPYSDWVPTVVFVLAGVVSFLQGLQRVRKGDNISLPIFGLAFLALAVVFAIPVLQPVLVPIFWFASKVGVLLFIFIWVRGTLPRFRYDQLMRFAWTFMFPVALLNLLITAFFVAVS